VHHLVDDWARLERERPGAGAEQIAALPDDDARILWDWWLIEEAAISDATAAVLVAQDAL
jgi:hypothetical protein